MGGPTGTGRGNVKDISAHSPALIKSKAYKRRLRDGGWGGIRTHETVARLHAFQACAFDHSATHPQAVPAELSGEKRAGPFSPDVVSVRPYPQEGGTIAIVLPPASPVYGLLEVFSRGASGPIIK